MKKFIFQCIAFSIPFIFIIISVILWDPFKVFFQYEDYYNSNIFGNRANTCLALFLKNNPQRKYNSFIIGNSKSLAFRVHDWQQYFAADKNFSGFHFDGSNEGIYGMTKMIKFLSIHTDSLKNILLILDYHTFHDISNKNEHLFILPPSISGESSITFYSKFIHASLDPKFIYYCIEYNLTKKYKPFMQNILISPDALYNSDNLTGDIYSYQREKDINSDSIKYYREKIKNGVFYDRRIKVIPDDTMPLITLARLKEIEKICKQHNTNIKIVISPLYEQISLGKKNLTTLNEIFGANNVFDFSGENEFTRDIGNYYEFSHYRPKVARTIMAKIYGNNTKSGSIK